MFKTKISSIVISVKLLTVLIAVISCLISAISLSLNLTKNVLPGATSPGVQVVWEFNSDGSFQTKTADLNKIARGTVNIALKQKVGNDSIYYTVHYKAATAGAYTKFGRLHFRGTNYERCPLFYSNGLTSYTVKLTKDNYHTTRSVVEFDWAVI